MTPRKKPTVIEYLTTEEVATRYRTAPSTIRYWRMIDYGPRGTKVGRRTLYPMDEVLRFDEELEGRINAQSG